MSPALSLGTLETDRLILRPRTVDDAAVFRQLWTERDPRVPPHRRIDADGRPGVDDIAAEIRADSDSSGPHLLAVELRATGDVVGYCGPVFHGYGEPREPELALELLRVAHGRGYATEAGRAVVRWLKEAGYPRVWATVWDWNLASRRVLAKLGFKEVATTESGVHGDSLLTELVL